MTCDQGDSVRQYYGVSDVRVKKQAKTHQIRLAKKKKVVLPLLRGRTTFPLLLSLSQPLLSFTHWRLTPYAQTGRTPHEPIHQPAARSGHRNFWSENGHRWKALISPLSSPVANRALGFLCAVTGRTYLLQVVVVAIVTVWVVTVLLSLSIAWAARLRFAGVGHCEMNALPGTDLEGCQRVLQRVS